MDASRRARLAAVLAHDDGPPVLDRLVALCVELLAVSGAGIAVIGDGRHLGALAVSGPGVAPVDELQFSLGEGPCLDADRAGGPVLEPDLALATHWPAFPAAALGHGVRAVFSFPLRLGAVRLGVLSLYRDRPGDLGPVDLRDAVALAGVATHLVVDLQADVAPGLLPGRLAEVNEHRAQVHQATGMIAAQLGTDVANALSRLRAFAWARSRSLDEVAAEVAARRLRFDGTDDGTGP